ncbi:hypothetical protein N8I77_006081 [Diaporthe amygdali]|uniref:Apc15p protein-domain-containing protein n=1 Tax=Phomopsis amygdali TaxID=1214568 RepID=A0AAD9SFU9_PHOAM|nr:hypothetical protein N8I77_006081 [Diaporthe amygdali]
MDYAPMLPDLTPRDSHSLWYTSRHTHSSLLHQLNGHDASPSEDHNNNNNHAGRHGQHPSGHGRDHRRALVERTPLARLRLDEQIMERRRQNVTNFGSAWLKPPGVPKTLFQMREERREAEEHAEAMRREQELAAQLAEAEAEAEGADDLDDEHMEEGGGEEEPDLDDEIPEAEGFGFDGGDSDEEESEADEEDDDDETDGDGNETTNNAGPVLVSPAERRDMQATEDRVREVMAQGQEGGGLTIDEDAVDDEDRAQMLEEDDLIHDYHQHGDGGEDARPGDLSMDMDMDADLDDDIPEADGRYEHTDSEAEISDDETREISFVSGGRAPQASRFRRSLPRSSVRGSQRGSLAQSEIDFSGLLSTNESSYLASSPQMRRRG